LFTPEQRRQRARKAAHTLHATHDSKEITAQARAAFNSRFEKEVDPEGLLSPEERQRRAEHARKAYFVSLALKSSRARRNKSTKPHKSKNKPPIEAARGEV
jgi:hypothetical protein